jgi:chromosome partitioning protein
VSDAPPGAGRVIVVVGAGAANLKSTVAANLAAAFAVAGLPVALADADGASSRALAAPVAPAVDMPAQLPWASTPVRLAAPTAVRPASADELLVVDPPPRLGTATLAAVAASDVVLVPVDATPLALRVLRDVVALVRTVDRRPVVRTALARLVPREADRWGLVEQVDALAPGTLLHTTLPMTRSVRHAAGDPLARQAVLYAPGTAAARAYASLARELVQLSNAP